mgnify:CR=1 FL=1
MSGACYCAIVAETSRPCLSCRAGFGGVVIVPALPIDVERLKRLPGVAEEPSKLVRLFVKSAKDSA